MRDHSNSSRLIEPPPRDPRLVESHSSEVLVVTPRHSLSHGSSSKAFYLHDVGTEFSKVPRAQRCDYRLFDGPHTDPRNGPSFVCGCRMAIIV